MRDQDKPFILYRSSRWSVRIVPRNAAGRLQAMIWMALMVPLTGGFIWFAAQKPQGTVLYLGLTLYLVATMVWGLGGIVWMRARAETVDLDELLELKREQDRSRRRR